MSIVSRILLLFGVFGSHSASAANVIEQLLDQGAISNKVVQLFLLGMVLSIAPAIVLTVTSFTRIIIVLSMLRNALGLQQSPPNPVLVSLSLFLTFFIMSPAFEQAYHQGIEPWAEQRISEEQALPIIVAPFKKFMLSNTRKQDLELFVGIAKLEIDPQHQMEDTPLKVLIPAFIISELKRAFEIGFLLFLPFIIIDIVVSSVLMAMGMMMMPPVTLSLPFKVIFFVLIDGWYLVVGSLVKSFN